VVPKFNQEPLDAPWDRKNDIIFGFGPPDFLFGYEILVLCEDNYGHFVDFYDILCRILGFWG